MAGTQTSIPEKYRRWIVARNRLKLTHEQVCMALLAKIPIRRLHREKRPARYIAKAYLAKVGRVRPRRVVTLEQLSAEIHEKRLVRTKRKALVTDSMGEDSGQQLRRLRIRAHQAAERLWDGGENTEQAVRKWLARELGLAWSTCHFTRLTEQQLQQVIDVCCEVSACERVGPPVVRPATSRTRIARTYAVDSLAPYMNVAGKLPVRNWLASHLGMANSECDLRTFSFNQCVEVITLCQQAASGHIDPPTRLSTKSLRKNASRTRGYLDALARVSCEIAD